MLGPNYGQPENFLKGIKLNDINGKNICKWFKLQKCWL